MIFILRLDLQDGEGNGKSYESCTIENFILLCVFQVNNESRDICFLWLFCDLLKLFLFFCHLGPLAEEQPRPTEQMNGVLNDDELPPQVIKRYA